MATRTILVVTEPLAAGCVIAAPGLLRLQGPGIAGLTYTVQVSTNLVDWVDHASVTTGPDGMIDYTEALGNDSPARFYRLKWP